MPDAAIAALVIIGGGPTAHAALKAYRKADSAGRVVMVSEDSVTPYNRPPLSKDFLRGESDEDVLPLESAEFYSDNRTELLLADSVTALDPRSRTVTTRYGTEIRYEQCILATGCEPASLDVPGGNTALRLRWLDQARRLRDAAQTARSAVVIGSGFIGCEAAASLAHRGIAVTMVSTEPLPQLHRLGPAAAELITGWLEGAGVRIHHGVQVTDIGNGRIVRLSDGTVLSADLLLSAVGATPRTELAEAAGAHLRQGRVAVDEAMHSSVANLLAAGDVAMAYNTGAARHLTVEHWGEAERMGEIAGITAAGGQAQWSDVPGFWSEIGDHTLKYAAWGDGFDEAIPVHHDDGGLTVWYVKNDVVVGVLTSRADDDYDRGQTLISAGAPVPVRRSF
ncbi:MAG: NAD(P)/FAD-dependent oxidoreductase [Nakamurella sp.]